MPNLAEPATAAARAPDRARAPVRGLSGIPAEILRLWACFVAAVCALAFAGTAVVASAYFRGDAVDAIRQRTAPLLSSAWDIHASLAEADAIAASTFLSGKETATERAAFDEDTRRAQSEMITGARSMGSGAVGPECTEWQPYPGSANANQPPTDAAAALTTLACQVPVYVGLIDEARANNRQHFPVGAAYLRRASRLMQSAILPAAATLTGTAESRQDATYRRATRGGEVALTAVLGACAIVILLAVQVALARWTRRRVNAFLVPATLLIIAALAWALVAFGGERASLVRAHGYATPAQLDLLRVRAFRVESDALHWRIAQGGSVSYDQDFTVREKDIRAQISAVFGVHSKIGMLTQDALAAGRAALDPAGVSSADAAQNVARVGTSFSTLDRAVVDARTRALTTFQANVAAADRHLAGLSAGSAIMFVLAIGGCLEVFRRRMGDYR